MKIYQAIGVELWFTFIIAIPPYWLNAYGHADLITPQFWLIFFFLSGLSMLVVVLILIIRQMHPTFFSEAFMGATVVKILACLVFVLVFLAKNKVNKHVFLGDFFYVYFLNTAFEVYILLRTLRHKILR
jgi:glucan phosphoethanolaminetransferase (alkaline phosphatase superfamily)